MAFLDRLRSFSAETRRVFEAGSPVVHTSLATKMSPLFGTFGSFIEAMPRGPASDVRDAFNDLIRPDQLQEALVRGLAAGNDQLADSFRKDPRLLMQEAVDQGIVLQTARDKNALYRFRAEENSANRLRGMLRAHGEALGIETGEDLDDYYRYIADANMNVNEMGKINISPNRFLTYEGYNNVKSAYTYHQRHQDSSVWNRTQNRKIIAFDLETAGGVAHAADVNEVVAQKITMGSQGMDIVGPGHRQTFSVNAMTLGVFNDAGTAKGLNIKFAPPAGTHANNIFGSIAADGSDFVEKLTPMLREMADADAILGQNIMGFDIDRLIGNVIRTAEYQRGGDIVDIIDTIQGKMGKGGYVIDTLQMLGEYERNVVGETLERSKLLPQGSTTRSIENILMNTNLVEFMENQRLPSGISLWEEAISSAGGHHTARYDTIVTASLYDAMTSGELQFYKRDEAIQALGQRRIKEIVTAKAYTPMSTISNPADILDDTWRQMYELGKTDKRAMRLMPVIPGSRDVVQPGQGMTLQQMRAEALDPDSAYYLDTNITYTDQASIHTRNMARVGQADNLTRAAAVVGETGSAWRNMTGIDSAYHGVLNAGGGSIFKHGAGFDLDEFGKYQQSINDLPFAHIGLPERHITMAASIATRTAQGAGATNLIDDIMPGALRASNLVEDLGISFFTRDSTRPVEFMGRQRHTLSMGFNKAMELNEIAGGHLFGDEFAEDGLRRLSINISPGDEAARFVNAQLEVNTGVLDEDTMVKIRSALPDLGYDDEAIADIEAFFSQRKNQTPMRITVGSVQGSAADIIHDAVRSIDYNVRDADIKMAVLDVADEAVDEGMIPGRSVVQLAPATLRGTYSSSEEKGIRKNLTKLRELTTDLTAKVDSREFYVAERARDRANRMKRTPGSRRTLADVIPEGIGRDEYLKFKEDIRSTVDDAYTSGADFLARHKIGTVSDNARFLKRATLPLAVAGALGMYVAKKSKETSPYDATFEMGDTRNNGYYSGGDFSSADPIHKRITPRMNPLATANLVFDNYDNRRNHTRPPGRM